MSMTDPVAPELQQQPVAPAADPAAPKDYQALYAQEVQGRIAERERYKPFARTLDRLDPQQQQAMLALAEAAANGDTDAIAEWSKATYQNLTGAEIAAQVAAAQTGATAAPLGQQPAAPTAPVTPAGLTAEQVAEIVRRENAQAQMVQRIEGELAAAGHQPGSPAAQTIIRYAQQTKLPMADAIAWYNADLAAQYAKVVGAGQQVAGAVPPVAPAGSPAGPIGGATPRDRALSRLQGGVRQ
jgi:hypothetical protein